ncbi:hypothetical protein DY000_02009687 [Brassica cretica]|uniref:Uncharacterized protein n=1 Tax=Brassica cretica TaxID=69181 RepID=A0ABQ7C1Z8_BRACR|nr:hypothetical protein DY000_02009687 [Brassica cretica]
MFSSSPESCLTVAIKLWVTVLQIIEYRLVSDSMSPSLWENVMEYIKEINNSVSSPAPLIEDPISVAFKTGELYSSVD